MSNPSELSIINCYKTCVPDRYEKLVWIKSTGSQYVNVGSFKGNKIKIAFDGIMHPKIDPPGADDGLLEAFGTRNYGGSSTSAQMVGACASQANHFTIRMNGSWSAITTGTAYTYERHKVTLCQESNTTTLEVVDGNSVSYPANFNISEKDIYFLGPYHSASSTFYNGQVIVNDVEVLDLYPAYDRVEGHYGLMDLNNPNNPQFFNFNVDTGLTCERYPIESDTSIYTTYTRTVIDNNNEYTIHNKIVVEGE